MESNCPENLISDAQEAIAIAHTRIFIEPQLGDSTENAAMCSAVCAYYTLALQIAEPIELANGVIAELENDMDLDGLASIVARATEAMDRVEKMERN